MKDRKMAENCWRSEDLFRTVEPWKNDQWIFLCSV